jgi:phospholipase C
MMDIGNLCGTFRRYISLGAALTSTLLNLGTPALAADAPTTTPIKHVIVIIGENRSFDHVFATYKPQPGQTVMNLLSQGIILLDAADNATIGPNFARARQLSAQDNAEDGFLLAPPTKRFPGNLLPAPLVGGPSGAQGYFSPTVSSSGTITPPCPGQPELSPLACAVVSEKGLLVGDYGKLASGGTRLASRTPDTRITSVTTLPAGPFQITNGKTFTYNDYAASPVHRFYQMWQQLNCSTAHSRADNPTGCNAQLFSWVEVTVGAGTNGNQQAPLCSNTGGTTPCFTTNYLPNVPHATTTGEGSTALAFYNVQQGDAPYFKELADTFAMSDNFHQSVHGGTGANHIMFGHADAIWFSDGKGNAKVPPNNTTVYPNSPNQGIVHQIENPNPASGTNNWYAQDGYGGGGFGSPVFGGGSYSECANADQPGVGPVVAYLKSIGIDPRCEPGHYYLLNNYNPGYFGNGNNAYVDHNKNNTPFTIPPSSTPSIGDDLNANNISWKYYGDQWDNYLPDPYQLNYGVNGPNADEYCNICNPFQYDTSIMAKPNQRTAHLADSQDLYSDITSNTLSAVSIVKPSGYVDGHPASSKLNLFESFTQKIVNAVKRSPYWKDTAIFITFDEGGGYYDSGYVQPLDFFGDGTRIPLLVVSAFSKGGYISHEYADHVSILKFIERNWNIPPVTNRSRDNFPNPTTKPGNPYVPTNGPALSDLCDFFNGCGSSQ